MSERERAREEERASLIARKRVRVPAPEAAGTRDQGIREEEEEDTCVLGQARETTRDQGIR